MGKKKTKKQQAPVEPRIEVLPSQQRLLRATAGPTVLPSQQYLMGRVGGW